MARLVIGTDFESVFGLAKKIKAKRDEDGTSSELIAYLTKQDIDLGDMVADGVAAEGFETTRLRQTKEKENFRELRDLEIKPLTGFVKGSVQFLKALFKPNVHDLGTWGITVNGSGKIVYPADFLALCTVYKNFIDKNESFTAGTSPLQSYLTKKGITLSDGYTVITNAIEFHNKFLAASNDAEDATASRNNLWDPQVKIIHGIGDYLMKLNDSNPKSLGKYGFTVDDSPKAPKERKTSIKLGEQKTLTGVIVGGTLTNLGESDVHVYKGKTATGTAVIVHAGEKLGMTKGYGVVTVVNPSTLKAAKVKVLRSV